MSRIVLIIWCFVVLLLTSSYTASFTSMLTEEDPQPTVTDIQELIRNGDSIGYQKGSFVKGFIQRRFKNLDLSKLKEYNNPEEYSEALNKGSRMGGVAAIIEETPYIKLFLAKYCNNYTMVGPTYKTAGFGFAFPKGSPLVAEVSSAVLNVIQGDKIEQLERSWFEQEPICHERSTTSDSLSLTSFKGLFFLTGAVTCSALLIFICSLLYKNRDVFYSEKPIRKKLQTLFERYNRPIPDKGEPAVGQLPNQGEPAVAQIQNQRVHPIVQLLNEGVPATVRASNQVQMASV